jgi:RecJ-like exonuclease
MKNILYVLVLSFAVTNIIFAFGDDKDKYGKEIKIEEKTNISDILNNPESFIDKTVLVEGEILDVCPMMGCWIELKSDDENGKIRVKVKDGEIVFPKEVKGKVASVQGKVYKIELTKERAIEYFSHEAEETGNEFDPASVTGPVTLYQIKGIGAEIEKD